MTCSRSIVGVSCKTLHLISFFSGWSRSSQHTLGLRISTSPQGGQNGNGQKMQHWCVMWRLDSPRLEPAMLISSPERRQWQLCQQQTQSLNKSQKSQVIVWFRCVLFRQSAISSIIAWLEGAHTTVRHTEAMAVACVIDLQDIRENTTVISPLENPLAMLVNLHSRAKLHMLWSAFFSQASSSSCLQTQGRLEKDKNEGIKTVMSDVSDEPYILALDWRISLCRFAFILKPGGPTLSAHPIPEKAVDNLHFHFSNRLFTNWCPYSNPKWCRNFSAQV